jgi:hypothetical protein
MVYGEVMQEAILVLMDMEKQMVEELILKLASGEFLAKRLTTKTNSLHCEVSYEYRSNKHEKTICGAVLNCRYRLRYRDRDRIFFSAWDCKDVCSVFYDIFMVIYAMNHCETTFPRGQDPFVPDLDTERYVFCTDQLAVSLAKMADFLHKNPKRVSHNSQYVLSLFEEPNQGEYGALIDQLKTNGYSAIRIVEIWLRGEILYYVAADGVILRPGHQRTLTPKEEADLNRKIYKAVNERFHFVDLTKPEIFSGSS